MNTSKFMAMAILSLASFKTYSARIMLFFLNNEKEFHVMEEFTEKLNRYSPIKIEVQEFLPKEETLRMHLSAWLNQASFVTGWLSQVTTQVHLAAKGQKEV